MTQVPVLEQLHALALESEPDARDILLRAHKALGDLMSAGHPRSHLSGAERSPLVTLDAAAPLWARHPLPWRLDGEAVYDANGAEINGGDPDLGAVVARLNISARMLAMLQKIDAHGYGFAEFDEVKVIIAEATVPA